MMTFVRALHSASADELVYSRYLLPAAEHLGDHIAFVNADCLGGAEQTLGDHVQITLRLVSALRRVCGLGKEDRFAVLAGNSARYANLWHAAYMGGGVITSLNTRLARAELEYILQHSEARVVFADSQYLEIVLAMRASGAIPHVTHVVVIDADLIPAGADATWEMLVANGTPDLTGGTSELDPCVLMYTGGTTGLPKGVVMSQRAVVLNFHREAMHHCHLRHPIQHLLFMPMFHIGAGFAVSLCLGGGTCHIQTRFDPANVFTAIKHYSINHLGGAPSTIKAMLNHPRFNPEDLRSLRTLLYGASPMPHGTLLQVQEALPWLELHQAYGATETGPLATMLTPEDHRNPKYLESAGRALPGVELSIQDDAGNLIPSGTVGEVCLRSGSLLTEYWKNPEETSAALWNGWYHTGDAGYLDEKHYLFLVDRKKDMIVSGGENVYSVEVEHAISTHPAVLDVAVIGIPSEKWGEAVHAIIVIRDGHQAPTVEDVVTHCRDLIAGYKIPRSIDLRLDPFPLSGAMKALKRDLRKPYWENAGVNIA